MLITGEKWTEDANTGKEDPHSRALDADGRRFYAAWQVLRRQPEFFFVVDMPGSMPAARGAGRQDYLAGQFTEFCADSFMHLALKKAALETHVRDLPETEGAVKAAWQTALSVLLKYEELILGRGAGGAAVIAGHRSNLLFIASKKGLAAALVGPEAEVADAAAVRSHFEGLRKAWQGLSAADRERHRGAALAVLDAYIQKVYRRRPAQAHLGSELGFPGL
jgi:hypothetical protein